MFFPVIGDQYRNFVSLHLPMTGENNSTTFTDISPTPKTITRYGDTKILTAISKWGQGSAFFDGTGDYLSTPNNAAFLFGVGNFTIEAWVYATAFPGAGTAACIASLYDTGVNARSWALNILNNSGTYQIQAINSSTGSDATPLIGGSLSLNTWYHLAFTRSGNTRNIFLNGVNVGSDAYTASLFTSSVLICIGRYNNNSSPWTGYMQDLRITKGVARYTANFAPPTGLLFTRLPELRVQQRALPSPNLIAQLGL